VGRRQLTEPVGLVGAAGTRKGAIGRALFALGVPTFINETAIDLLGENALMRFHEVREAMHAALKDDPAGRSPRAVTAKQRHRDLWRPLQQLAYHRVTQQFGPVAVVTAHGPSDLRNLGLNPNRAIYLRAGPEMLNARIVTRTNEPDPARAATLARHGAELEKEVARGVWSPQQTIELDNLLGADGAIDLGKELSAVVTALQRLRLDDPELRIARPSDGWPPALFSHSGAYRLTPTF